MQFGFWLFLEWKRSGRDRGWDFFLSMVCQIPMIFKVTMYRRQEMPTRFCRMVLVFSPCFPHASYFSACFWGLPYLQKTVVGPATLLSRTCAIPSTSWRPLVSGVIQDIPQGWVRNIIKHAIAGGFSSHVYVGKHSKHVRDMESSLSLHSNN